ncbi:MAG: peptidylprolyl isomerase [Pacificimonas sp.]
MKLAVIITPGVIAFGIFALPGGVAAQDAEPDLKVAAQAEAQAAEAAAAAPVVVNVQPPAEIASDPENILNLDLSTGGRVSILMRPDIAPAHVERYRTLAKQGFYDGIVFHRVIPGFMAQTGDPTGTGQGGSDLPDLKAEFTRLPHLRGTVSAARTNEPDTANSQFFIVFQPRSSLDENYTAFGRVIAGMQYAQAIAVGEPPQNPSRIIRASIGNDAPPPSAAELSAATANDGTSDLDALQSQLPPGVTDTPERANLVDEDGAERIAEELAGETPVEHADTDSLVDTPEL